MTLPSELHILKRQQQASIAFQRGVNQWGAGKKAEKAVQLMRITQRAGRMSTRARGTFEEAFHGVRIF